LRGTTMQSTYVIIHNDDEHSYQYVMNVFCNVFKIPPHVGFLLAQEIHHSGKCLIEVADDNTATTLLKQMETFGADALIPGSTGPLKLEIERGEATPSCKFTENQFELCPRLQARLQQAESNIAPDPIKLRTGLIVNGVALAITTVAKISAGSLRNDVKLQSTILIMALVVTVVLLLWSAFIFYRARKVNDDGRASLLAFGSIVQVYLVFKILP
jgi:ATP-dependent Clp protease adaptor protein ClpS